MRVPHVKQLHIKIKKDEKFSSFFHTYVFVRYGALYNIEFSIATLQNGEKIAYAKKLFGYDDNLTKNTDRRSYGFRLGVKLIAEAFPLPLGENNHRSGIGEIRCFFTAKNICTNPNYFCKTTCAFQKSML